MLTTLVDLKGISLAYNTKGSDVGSCLGKGKAAIILRHQRSVKAELLEDFSSKVALGRNVNSPKKLHKFSLTPAVPMAT